MIYLQHTLAFISQHKSEFIIVVLLLAYFAWIKSGGHLRFHQTKRCAALTKPGHRFERWEDAVPFMGKQVKVKLVESPDITGRCSGIFLEEDDNKNVIGYLKVGDGFWGYWQVTPLEENKSF